MTEKKALHLDKAKLTNTLSLLFRLNTLSSGCYFEALRHVRDRLHDGKAVILFRNILDEGAIDLDPVEWKAPQIAERGVSDTEIIHRNPDPEVAQLMQRGQRRE